MKEAIFDDAVCARYDADGLAVPEWGALVAQLDAMREARAALREAAMSGNGSASGLQTANHADRVNHAASDDRKTDRGFKGCNTGRHGRTSG